MPTPPATSRYIDIDEAALYGLTGVDTNQIIRASILIDAHLKRPQGLVWMPDYRGAPAYMKAMNPM